MTNAERIKSMTDEELARVITDVAFDLYNCNECEQRLMTTIKPRGNCDNRCGLCVLIWLKDNDG